MWSPRRLWASGPWLQAGLEKAWLGGETVGSPPLSRREDYHH
jgi:hypothetical protein